MSTFTDRNELVVPASRAKLVGIALGAAGFVLAGAWLITLAPEEGLFVALVGVASILFFGLCGAYATYRIVRPQPAVVINGEGIFDNASGLGVGWIRWDEIADLQEYQFKGQTFLGVLPRDLDRLLAKQPAWKRSALRANLALGIAPINIPQVALPMRVSELLREIRSRYQFDT